MKVVSLGFSIQAPRDNSQLVGNAEAIRVPLSPPSRGPQTAFWETTVKITPRSRQFRPIEMAPLEKRQRQFKEPRLHSLEFEVFPTVGHRADCSKRLLVLSTFGLLPNDNPSPTFRTSDARARNAISHFKIILRLEQSTVDGTGMRRNRPTYLRLGEFCGRTHLGWCTVLGPLQFVTKGAKACLHRGFPMATLLLRSKQGPANGGRLTEIHLRSK